MQTRIHKLDGGMFFVSERSLQELADIYERPPHKTNLENLEYAKVAGNAGGASSAWYGGLTSQQQAIDLLNKGWKEGTDRLKELTKEVSHLVPPAMDRKRRPVWSDDGDSIDVDKALAGQWDTAYRVARRQWSPGPAVVDLWVAWGGNGDKRGDQLFWSGAAMLVVTDMLEEAGYSVRVSAVKPVEHYHHGLNYSLLKTTIKDAGEPLRMDGIAGVVCHAGVFRSFGFRYNLDCPFDVTSSFGRLRTFAEMKSLIQEHGEWPEGAIMMDSAYSKEQAIGQIQSAMRQVNEMDNQRKEGI